MKKYETIMQSIRRSIESGAITPGQKLPSESELMESFNVSRNAVRQAVHELAKTGLVESRHGVGTFCLRPSPRESMIVGLVCLRMSSYIFPRIIDGCNRTLHGENYHLLVNESRYDLAQESRVLSSLRKQQVDGIIITPVQHPGEATNAHTLKELEREGIPVVLLDNEYPDYALSSVALDDVAGGMKAAKHLWEQGHREIGVLYSLNYRPKILRKRGVAQFLQSKGIEMKSEWVVGIEGQTSPAHTYRQIRELFKRNAPLPSAMVCSSDDEAIMFIHQARQYGIQIPEQVSIVSFDNSDLARVSHPRLTSLHHPGEHLGELAATLLLQKMRRREFSLRTRTVVDPVLIPRDSVRSLADAPSACPKTSVASAHDDYGG